MRVVRGGASQGGAVPLYPLRQMPFEQATAWGPALTGDARPSRPEAPGQVFITPDALRAVTWHTSSRRDGGCVGFLAGRRHLDPDTREPWVLVDAVIPIDRPVARELPGRLIDDTIDEAGDVARAALRYLVGWYHSHHARQPVLTAAAAETHERYFADELHALVIVVTVGHDEPQGAVFRPGVERGPVPFFEWLEHEGDLAKHPRPTALQWRNYFTVDTVKREVAGRRSYSLWDPVSPPTAKPPSSAQTPAETTPTDAVTPARDADEPPPTTRPSYGLERGASGQQLKLVTRDDYVVPSGEPIWARLGRRRAIGLGAIAVAVLAVIAFVATRGPDETPAPAPVVTASPPPPSAFDSTARSVTAAVRAYRDLALLFDRHQVGCERLGVALVTLEDRWMSYAIAKGGLGAPLDAAAASRERALDAGVREAEEHFLASTCPRP